MTPKEDLLFLISTPLYFLVILFEIFLSNWQDRKLYTVKDTLANLYLTTLNASLDLGFRLVYLVVLGFFATHSSIHITNAVWYWVMLVLLEDFIFYWLHRMEHYVRLFWAVHVTHHSSEQFNFTVGFRSSVFQPLYRFIFFIPLAFLGFSPLDIVFTYSLTQTWGIMVHTKLINKMGWLEHIFVTPSHHRVHHASNTKYLDKNMGMFLIVWDKLFGTFQPELDASEYEPLRFGLTTNIEDKNAINLVVHEWKSITKDIKKRVPLKTKLGYLFGPPGWSHDGSTLTSKEMRMMEDEDHLRPEHSREEFIEIPAAIQVYGHENHYQ
ncbi:MAG: sterol desaturase family protein [Bacteroidota bacterium]